MRSFFRVVCTGICLLVMNGIHAQTLTNKGTDFWFAFPHVIDSTNALFWVNVASNVATTGTVEIPGTSFSQAFSVAANGIARINLPSTDANIRGSMVQRNRAIHVTSNDDVVVYAVTYRQFRHEASLVLPTHVLGQKYRVMTYNSEIKGGVLWRSEFVVVATTDTAYVEINYTDSVLNGGGPSTPDTVSILPNHVYQAQAHAVTDDLSGSFVRSLNGKDFAVYSGNEWSTVLCTPNSDPLLEVMYPVESWGQTYFAVPTYSINKDYIKIVAHEDTTVIFRNGIAMDTIDGGEFWDDTITTTRVYKGSKPIEVGQFLITGQNFCSPNNWRTDPSMIMLNAVEQMYLDSITFFAVDTNQIDSHFVSIITRTSDTGKVFLDSVKVTGFTQFPLAQSYSYRWKTIDPGTHNLWTTGCGFQAYSMGVGRAVSYAYAAGVTLLDLENAIQFKNFIDGSDTICLGDTVQFEAITRDNPLSIHWDLGDGTTDTVRDPVHIYQSVGSYRVEAIIVYDCLTDTLVDTVNVPPPPIIDLGPDTTLCNLDTLSFTVNTPTFNVRWSTGSTQKWIKIARPDTYHVEVYNFCGFDRDTIVVDSLYPDTVNLGPDTLICVGDSLYYNIQTINNTHYLWWDGDTGFIKVLDSTGLYWAEVSNACGVRRDSIDLIVESPPLVDFGPDTALCTGTIMFLNATNSRATYLWQNGSNLGGMNVVTPGGLYHVRVTNPCGTAFDSLYVHYDFPLNPNIGPDTLLCDGDTLSIGVSPSGGIVTWDNALSDSIRAVTSSGQYWVAIENLCGIYRDTINIDNENTPFLKLPDDTTFCLGESIDVAVSYSRSTYLWSTGSTDSSETLGTDGTHWVKASNVCGDYTDSIKIIIDEPITIDFGPDLDLCNTDTFLLDARITTNGIHFWSHGNFADTLVVRNSGIYWVNIENTCGEFGDTIHIFYDYAPKLDFFDDTTLCSGTRFVVEAPPVAGASFNWNDGSRNSIYEVFKAGDYWLEVFNRCGEDVDSFTIYYQPFPPLDLDQDDIICPRETRELDGFVEGNYTYEWTDGSTHPVLVAEEPGVYYLTVTDEYDCASIDSIVLTECEQIIYIPSAFSPNLDGINERFGVKGERLRDFRLDIRNRWGELLYQTYRLNDSWDGKYKGEDCQVGTYTYQVHWKDLKDQQQIRTGVFQLIR